MAGSRIAPKRELPALLMVGSGLALAACGGAMGVALQAMPAMAEGAGLWPVLAVVVGMGVLLGVLGASRLRWTSSVTRALRMFESGERSVDGLKIADREGPATGWNRLVDWMGELQSGDRADRAVEMLAARIQRPGDESLTSAVDALWMGMLLLDESMVIRQCNGAAASLLRQDKDTLLNKALPEVLADERVLKAAKSVATGLVRRKCTAEIELNSEDGGRSVLRCTVRPVRKTEASSVLMVIEDVTQQHEADRARSELVAQAAHELRTPLTNIRLYMEELIEDGASMSETERGQALNVVSQETRRLERIVSDMLSMSEIEAGKLSIVQDDVRIEDVLNVLKQDYAAQARDQNLTLAFELAPKLPVLRGDRDKITLAMHNLVSNALKYTPAGGEVRVSVDCTDDRFVFEVADTGVGIAPEQIERVFERFYRCQDSRTSDVPGTGLGLSLARDVARLHGGDVKLESVLDKGSRFVLELPIAA